MRRILLLLFLCGTIAGEAQNVSYKGEAIYVNNKPFALLKQTHVIPQTYTLENFSKMELVRIYPGKAAIKGQQYYIVTFINDGRKAVLKDKKNFINQLVITFAKNNIVKDGAVNVKAEALFIKDHPVPKGYQDVEELYDY